MATVSKKGELIVVGSNVRIEQGPVLRKAIANSDILSNEKTAAHYQTGAVDAAGNVIEEGKEFSYLDWGGSDNPGKTTYYIYVKEDVSDDPETSYEYRYKEVATRATEEAAIEFAQKYAKE